MRLGLMLIALLLPGVVTGEAVNTPDDKFIADHQSRLLALRERAATIDAMTLERFRTVLPSIMRQNELDMWVIIAREYNEDPVMKTMLPAKWLSARRRTILVFHDAGEGQPLERLAVVKYAIGNLFERAWDEDAFPDQYTALANLIAQRDPDRIGINMSPNYGLADGLSATEHRLLSKALPEKYQNRLVSAQGVAVGWLETRADTEMTYYPELVKLGHALIARAFSNEVVTPGETTTDDVEWWLRKQTAALALSNWFHPTVSLQRANATKGEDFSSKDEADIILPGDLLHVDFGMKYLTLHSDQQQHAYVLRAGESKAPAALQDALATGNRLQDIFTANFRLGVTGNHVLKVSRKQAIEEGIKPMIYTHPIGFHGHAAGTTLGMWDAQQGVPVSGDYPLHANTAYSIELNAAVDIEAWGGDVRIMLEEQAFFDGDSVHYLDDRQTSFHLIRSEKQ